ncbi:MAG: restriction endonuclease subunit S [Methanobrevibacter sp.]|jgi:type I restriction enzyme S subunit|nr:restriction endonuclease subunit S [Methanobrevibacter sp.]
MSKNNTPKLRFPEFSDDWEENIGKNIFKLFGGGSFKSSDSVENGIKWLKIANIGINKIKTLEMSFLPKNFKNQYQNYILKKEDVVLALTRPILNHKLKIAIVDDCFNDSLLNQRVGKITKVKQNSDKFIYYLLQLPKNVKYMEDVISGSDPPNISNKDILMIKINTPSLKEQEKISSFLLLIDKKINLLEEKLCHFNDFKKYCLQQLFSQKLRFKKENEENYPDWDEKKLGDIGTFSKGGSLSKSDLSKKGTKCILYGDLFTIYDEIIDSVELFTDIERKKLKFATKGDILFSSSTTVDAMSIASSSALMLDDVALGGDINAFTPKNIILSEFLSYQINHFQKKQIAKYAQGTTIIHLYNDSLRKVVINFPILEEQEKIANFLINLDNKIDKIAIELENTKEFKKALLQQMFV